MKQLKQSQTQLDHTKSPQKKSTANTNRQDSQTLQKVLAEYFKTQPVLKAWLFGSFARGEDTPKSDVDILVLPDYTKLDGFGFFGMWGELERLLGRSVDLVTDAGLATYTRESVERDKQLIYERTA
ncbi:MAG: nucleotidyltransferase family protein [Prevotella sp.]|nr:nucleotidyltransferase family protein [Prevotella sp.]MBQ2338665.1 nucleotidyltransferase family protein [Prevotella sp.]